jgi:hypothetical protein
MDREIDAALRVDDERPFPQRRPVLPVAAKELSHGVVEGAIDPGTKGSEKTRSSSPTGTREAGEG